MKKMKWMSGFVLLAVAVLPLQAVLLDQNFESLIVGTHSDAAGDTASDLGLSGWGGDKISTIETGRFDGKSLDMHDATGGNALYYLGGTTGLAKGVLSFDLSLEFSTGNGWQLDIDSGGDVRNMGLLIYQGYIQVRDAGNYRTLTTSNNNTASNHFELAYDSADTTGGPNGTYTVTLNGTLLSYDDGGTAVTKFGMDTVIGSGIRYILIKDRQANAGNLYMDNIVNALPPGPKSQVTICRVGLR